MSRFRLSDEQKAACRAMGAHWDYKVAEKLCTFGWLLSLNYLDSMESYWRRYVLPKHLPPG